jgi:FkbM family methyltransferase
VAEAIGRQSWLIRQLRPVYESLLDWSSGCRGIAWSINGVGCRIDPRHRHRLAQDYDAPVAAFLRDRVKAGAVCFDVGANVGVYVLQFAHWSHPTGRVVAFEPNPLACKVLHKHIRINQLTERVQVVAAAVGATIGESILYAAGADGMSRLGTPNSAIRDQVRAIKVPVITLDHYCESEGLMPDWLFIDIEGFELDALRGARRVIESCRGKLGIIVEMHPNVWHLANSTRKEAEALLDELGLYAVGLTGQSDPLEDYGIVNLAFR